MTAPLSLAFRLQSNQREVSRMDDQFQRGDLVTLRDVDPEPLGRVVTVSPAGDQAEVAWYKHAGHVHEVTLEPTLSLRRVHESEMSAEG